MFGDTLYYAKNPRELQRWNINYALIDTKTELDNLFPPAGWAQIYRDSTALLLLRRAPENQAKIERYEVFYFDPHKESWPRMRAWADNPTVYPRLMMEMANYLAYSTHPEAAQLFCEFIHSANSLSFLSNARRDDLLATATAYNPSLAMCTSRGTAAL